MTSRKPDYILKALNKKTDERSGRLGAAWANKNGSISLIFDAFARLESNPDWVFTLFPNDRPDEPVKPDPSVFVHRIK